MDSSFPVSDDEGGRRPSPPLPREDPRQQEARVQLLCAYGLAFTLTRIVQSDAIAHNEPIDHVIPQEDLRMLATELTEVRDASSDAWSMRRYYREIAQHERELRMDPEHDRPLLRAIRFEHRRHFRFPKYPYLCHFVRTHAGRALTRDVQD